MLIAQQVSVKNLAKESSSCAQHEKTHQRPQKVLCFREYTGQEHHYLTINPSAHLTTYSQPEDWFG